jgi:hypothetical protein
MTTYIYETITNKGEKLKHYEIEQETAEGPLTLHPRTGERIKRVVLGGQELVKDVADGDDSCGCGPSGCC